MKVFNGYLVDVCEDCSKCEKRLRLAGHRLTKEHQTLHATGAESNDLKNQGFNGNYLTEDLRLTLSFVNDGESVFLHGFLLPLVL